MVTIRCAISRWDGVDGQKSGTCCSDGEFVRVLPRAAGAIVSRRHRRLIAIKVAVGVKFARTKGRAVSLMKGKENGAAKLSRSHLASPSSALLPSLFPSLRSSSPVLNLNLPQERTRVSRCRTRDSIRMRCIVGCRDAESSRGMRCT